MTRLTESDIKGIPGSASEYNKIITGRLGLSLLELGAKANDVEAAELAQAIEGRRLAAVSVSSGGGVVGGFAQSVADIAARLGYEARVMSESDEKGFCQARQWGANYIIYADDHNYFLETADGEIVADNNPATSKAYVAALDSMAGSLFGREVLVLGAGIIGRGAAARIAETGGRPIIYDVSVSRASQAAARLGCQFAKSVDQLKNVLDKTNLVFDATPVDRALHSSLWPNDIIVAAPGVPLAWPRQWMQEDGPQKLWHDPLESGTAAMLCAVKTC